MSEAARFPWTRSSNGSWSAFGYVIVRQPGFPNPVQCWRIVRNGAFWDTIASLPVAKRACERDYERRQQRPRGTSGDLFK